MAGFGPTPDYPTVTLKWAGVGLDGLAETGSISLTYNSSVPLLDDDATTPVSVYPRTLTADITTTTIAVDDDANVNTAPITKTIGYWTMTVPASNVTAVTGSGGTYTLTENLTRGGGVTRTFFADKDVVGGVIWVNRLPAGGTSTPATPYSVVTVSDLTDAKSKVTVATTKTSAYTLTQGNAGALVPVSSSSSVAITVPSLATGSTVDILRLGSGAVTLTASGVTLIVPTGATAAPRVTGSIITLVWLSTTSVLVTGDLS
jgi:hypothetical protein